MQVIIGKLGVIDIDAVERVSVSELIGKSEYNPFHKSTATFFFGAVMVNFILKKKGRRTKYNNGRHDKSVGWYREVYQTTTKPT